MASGVMEVVVEANAEDRRLRQPVVLADFGSTYTKVILVDAANGALVARASHRTTVDTDIIDGFDAALEALSAQLPGVSLDEVMACSSAAGGLRLGVVGLEDDLTAEAGRKAALSAGARVVTVLSGGLGAEKLAAFKAQRPDIVLLTGGTDGGNRTCLVESARTLAQAGLGVPIVVAGNVDAQAEALGILRAAGREAVAAPNVMPDIGRIDEEPVRAEIRELFIRHVIGGKHLSSGTEFASMVRMPTPEAVLLATALLARGSGEVPGLGNLAVVDIGGATTDVHSVVEVHGGPESGYTRSVLPDPPVGRTVEGDLGLRWNAPGIVEAAESGGFLEPDAVVALRRAAGVRAADPGYIPADAREAGQDAQLASIAAKIALQRHAGELRVALSPDGAALRRTGKDLRSVGTVIGTGGIFVHASSEDLLAILGASHFVVPGRTLLLPERPRVVVDREYVMAAAGLLSFEHPAAAAALLEEHLLGVTRPAPEEDR